MTDEPVTTEPTVAPVACCGNPDAASQKPCELCAAANCKNCRLYVNARRVCPNCAAQIEAEVAAERGGVASVPGAILGGAAGALIGGGAWALIAIITNVAIGYVAIGVGFLAGYGVLLGAGRKKAGHLQLIAAACALLGLVVGKYVIVAHFVIAKYPHEGLSYVDSRLFQLFQRILPQTFNFYDVLWMILALMTAIRITKPTQVSVRGARRA